MDEIRFKNVEDQLSELKIDNREIKSYLKELAGDMSKLAIATAERTQDRVTIDRMFHVIEDLRVEVKQTDNKIEEHELKCLGAKAIEAKEELKESKTTAKTWIIDLTKMAITVLITIILYKYGIK